jgi:hypothetical protein
LDLTLASGLSTLTLPEGLLWEDEYQWNPVTQAVGYSITGALLVQEAEKLAGRPVTLAGGETWAWLSRVEVATLLALGDGATALSPLTLTFPDGRQMQALPRRDGQGGAWVEVHALPQVGDSGPSDPTDTTLYAVDRVRLMEAPAE